MATVPEDEYTNDPVVCAVKSENWEFCMVSSLARLYLCPDMKTNPPASRALSADPLQPSKLTVLSEITKPPPLRKAEALTNVDDTNEATLFVLIWPMALLGAE
jgi:hypothetical protein